MSAAHIAIEPDFLLVDSAGEIYYLPELDRGIKIKFIHKEVRVLGFKTKHIVHAEKLSVKKDGVYKKVWSLADEKKEIESYGP